MPNGINGFELAEQAKDNRHNLKVLFTSGYTKEVESYNDQLRFSKNLLDKPYNQTELAKKVRSTLDEPDSK